jgi:hypothetical protein
MNSKVYLSNFKDYKRSNVSNNKNSISDDTPSSQEDGASDIMKSEKRRIRFKRIKNCESCDGEWTEKFNICKIFSQMFYAPLWCLLATLFILVGVSASIVCLALSYHYSSSLATYTNACSSTLKCNTDKGLYCRINNGTTSDYCNCPAVSLANTCGNYLFLSSLFYSYFNSLNL